MNERLARLDQHEGPVDGVIPSRTMNATLIASKSKLVTREDLIALPAVQGTDTFKPVAHIELIRGIEHTLGDVGIQIMAEKLAISRDGSRMFGVMDLSAIPGAEVSSEFSSAMGIRTANNRTMSIQLGVGARVFICDNLAFGADMIALKRRHTAKLNVMDSLKEAIGRFIEKFWSVARQFAHLKEVSISAEEAKVRIYDVFAKGLVAPMYFKMVNDAYFNTGEIVPAADSLVPYDVEYKSTLWALHNAFTWALKSASIPVQQTATMALASEFAIQ